jgi:hypothetical protein
MNKRALLLLVSMLSSSAFLAHAETVGEALAKCSETKNSLQRLVCYDRAEKALNRHSGIQAPMPSAVAISPSTTNASPRTNAPVTPRQSAPVARQETRPDSEFGLEHKIVSKDLADAFSGTVVSISKTIREQLILTFDNGAVWRQTSDDSIRIRKGQTVTIERGVLGAFYAKIDGVKKRMKVERVK